MCRSTTCRRTTRAVRDRVEQDENVLDGRRIPESPVSRRENEGTLDAALQSVPECTVPIDPVQETARDDDSPKEQARSPESVRLGSTLYSVRPRRASHGHHVQSSLSAFEMPGTSSTTFSAGSPVSNTPPPSSAAITQQDEGGLHSYGTWR